MKKAMMAILAALCLFICFLGALLRNRELDALTYVADTREPSIPTEEALPEVPSVPDARQLGVSEDGSLGPGPYLPARLYISPEYYLYIPKEGWNLKQTDWSLQNPDEYYCGVPSHLWQNANGRSELRIAWFHDMTAEMVRSELKNFESGYDLYEDKQGGLGGSCTEDGTYLEIQLLPRGRHILMVNMRYHMEDLESDGYALHYMADSLVVYNEALLED